MLTAEPGFDLQYKVPGAHRRPNPARAFAAGFGALAAGLLFVVAHKALIDDVYIFLTYARNLADSAHWGLLPARTVNIATSPLNVWLLAAGISVTGRPVVSVGLLLVATMGVTGWWADGLRRDLGVSRVLPYVLVTLLVTSPLLSSLVGMETYLAAAVLALTIHGDLGRPACRDAEKCS